MNVEKIADLSLVAVSYARDNAAQVLQVLTKGLKEGMTPHEEKMCYLTTLHFLRLQVMASTHDVNAAGVANSLATIDGVAEMTAIAIVKGANDITPESLEKLAVTPAGKKAAMLNMHEMAAKLASDPGSLEDVVKNRNSQNYQGGSEL